MIIIHDSSITFPASAVLFSVGPQDLPGPVGCCAAVPEAMGDGIKTPLDVSNIGIVENFKVDLNLNLYILYYISIYIHLCVYIDIITYIIYI